MFGNSGIFIWMETSLGEIRTMKLTVEEQRIAEELWDLETKLTAQKVRIEFELSAVRAKLEKLHKKVIF